MRAEARPAQLVWEAGRPLGVHPTPAAPNCPWAAVGKSASRQASKINLAHAAVFGLNSLPTGSVGVAGGAALPQDPTWQPVEGQ